MEEISEVMKDLYINGTEYRSLHNKVKYENIKLAWESSGDRQLKLLDLACGRGGDIGKWQRLDPKARVVAADKCPRSVHEAMRRYTFYKKKDNRIKVFFIKNVDLTKSSSIQNLNNYILRYNLGRLGEYNVVSCQMALNYFLGSEESLLNILTLVSTSLRQGALATFSALDGNRVISLLDGKDKYINKGVYIENVSIDPNLDKRLGQEYKIFIADNTRTSYFDHSGVSSEYLLCIETLQDFIKDRPELKLKFWGEITYFGTNDISKMYFNFFLIKL